jgi:hypothetical protein
MPTAISNHPALAPEVTPLFSNLINVIACPGEVFEELAAAPPRVRNWLVPTLLAALAGVVLAAVLTPPGQAPAAIGPAIEAAKARISPARWQWFSAMAITLAAFAAMGWSALVLWFIGRVLLGARFSYGKAAEVVGLTGSIVVLGEAVTGLLAAAVGDPAARPALSLFAGLLPSQSPFRPLLGGVNVFHLWTTAVLALGLSKLSRVSFKESAFWVFGYWLVLRLALLVLG